MTRQVIIQLIELASGQYDVHEGHYVTGYHPVPAPKGTLYTSPSPQRARRFDSTAAAVAFWGQQHGLRPDGKPNKPLNAWTIRVLPAQGASVPTPPEAA